MAAMLCDVVRRRHRRWAHAPVIHAASHFDHKKRVAWVPISMHTCGSFFYNYGAPLGGPSGRRSSANTLAFKEFGTEVRKAVQVRKFPILSVLSASKTRHYMYHTQIKNRVNKNTLSQRQ